jgi:hypothetical protein
LESLHHEKDLDIARLEGIIDGMKEAMGLMG